MGFSRRGGEVLRRKPTGDEGGDDGVWCGSKGEGFSGSHGGCEEVKVVWWEKM